MSLCLREWNSLGKSTACSFLHNASDTIGEKKKKKKKKKKKTLYYLTLFSFMVVNVTFL